MGFSRHLRVLVAAVDEHLGERALWAGRDGEIVVHLFDADEIARLGSTEIIVAGRMVQVHRRWVPDPRTHDVVQLLDDDGGLVETLKVSAPPECDVDGYWRCVVTAA